MPVADFDLFFLAPFFLQLFLVLASFLSQEIQSPLNPFTAGPPGALLNQSPETRKPPGAGRGEQK